MAALKVLDLSTGGQGSVFFRDNKISLQMVTEVVRPQRASYCLPTVCAV